MIGLWIVLAHCVGDYVIQTDWMASEKTKRWLPAVIHGISYTTPYAVLVALLGAPLWPAVWTLLIIGGTHIVLDHYRLAKHVIFLKERFNPSGYRVPWSQSKKTGYPDTKPDFMAVWLMIIVDNTLHLIINAAAFAAFIL